MTRPWRPGHPGALRAFNRAGILDSADVHIAHRLAQLAGVEGDAAALGIAFAARAPRLGHVCVDLRTIRQTASRDIDLATDLDALPWPDPEAWLDALRQSPLVGQGNPLWLSGSNLYLNRLWLDERQVATELLARAEGDVLDVDLALLRSGLTTLFREDDPKAEDPEHLQPLAAATAVLRRVSVIAGGPGTGKTTTVARLLGLLDQQAVAHGAAPPLIALAAPTGKASLRLEEAVRDEATQAGIGSGHGRAAARAARHDAASAARACRRQPDPFSAQPVEPASARRRRRRRDLDGAPVHDGPAPRGAPS